MLEFNDIKVNIIAIIIGIYILYIGILRKSIIYKVLGSLWLIADGIMVFNPKLATKLALNNKFLFSVIFMLIPAWIMAPILFLESYKVSDFVGRVLAVIIFFVDNLHFFQYHKRSSLFLPFLLVFFGLLYLIRKGNPEHYDDLHPLIDMEKKYIDRSKYLFVIPKYENKSITDYPEWCNWLKNYAKKNNKVLCLHGIKHTEKNGWVGSCEFNNKISKRDLMEGVKIFKQAFGYMPKYFKSPCYSLLNENESMIRDDFGMKIVGPETMVLNKVFHPNKTMGLSAANKIIEFY